MTEKRASSPPSNDEQKIAQLREVLLGEDFALITAKIKSQARDIVKDVLAESLHDRQKQDNAIDKVLQPIVERSVEQSVSGHSDKLIGHLYPLVGSLVRKSVKAFLTDFIEKTNQLLENSLTIKGLKWRFKAHQAGISFAQYVATQTFVYRVEHLLLIHRETGILLKSIDYNAHSNSDVDLISSMLSAINDFVTDSFSHTEKEDDEQLQTVTTDNFTLLIKPGPYAMIVAAVTGNPPHELSDKLQLTLETLHSLYGDEMRLFQGDTLVFENTDSQLRDCLLAEVKSSSDAKKKKPWLAWLLFSLVLAGGVFWLFTAWQSEQLKNQILTLNQQPGYIIKSLKVGLDKTINLEVIRDPQTITVADWLVQRQLNIGSLTLTEHIFYSLDPVLQQQRIEQVFKTYPALNYQWHNELLVISGALPFNDKNKLIEQLAIIGINQHTQLDISALKLTNLTEQTVEQNNLKMQVFLQKIAEINTSELNFKIDEKTISSDMQQQLLRLVAQYQDLTEFAKQLNMSISLILIGTSDNSGNQYINNTLSLERALNAKNKLVELGLNKGDIYTSGIGQINLGKMNSSAELATRKVLCNIMYIKMDKTENKHNDSELVAK